MTKRDRLSNSKKDAIMNGLCSNTEWVGNSCGQHGSYVFYKGIRYRMPKYSSNVNNLNGTQENDDNATKTCILTRTKRRENRISSMTMVEKILGLGEFFFLQFREEDPVCIGELQLLWHDKQSDQDLSSSRLYYVPETTPSGRTNLHGQDEVLAVSEKVVMRVSDLVTLLVEPSEWDYGCKVPLLKSENGNSLQFRAPNALQRFGILRQGFSTTDIESSRISLQKSQPDNSPRADVIVLSLQNYNRYRALLSRLGNIDPVMLKKHFRTFAALGLHVSNNDRCRIVFCRDSFDYPQLLEHEFVCEELAAVFKGRPRKKVKKSKCQIKRSEVCAAKELSSSTRRVSARQKTKKRTHYDNYALIDEYKPKRRSRKRTNSNKTIRDNADDVSNEKGDAADSKVPLSPPLVDENSGSAKKKKKLNEDQTNKRKDLKLSLLSSRNGNYSINFTKNGSKESPSSSGSVTPASESGEKSSTPSSPFSTASSPLDSSFDSSTILDTKSLIRPDSRILKLVPQNKDNFLSMLYKHMQENSTPINKIPSLGFKRLDLWAFFQVSQQFGGYRQITEKRLWKHVYDKMGGNPSCTSAATSTRKHYEKLLLPFEVHLRKQLDQDKPQETDELKTNDEAANKNFVDNKVENNDVIIVENFTVKQPLRDGTDKGRLAPSPRDIHQPSASSTLPPYNHKILHSSRTESSSQYINLEKVAHEIIKAEFFAQPKEKFNIENHHALHQSLFMRPTVPKRAGSPPPLVNSNKKQVMSKTPTKEVEGHRSSNHQQFPITHTPRCSNAPPPFVPRKSSAHPDKDESNSVNNDEIKSSIIKPNPNFRKFDINNILFGGCGEKSKPPPLKSEAMIKTENPPSTPKTNNGLMQGVRQSNSDIKSSTSTFTPIVPPRSHQNHKLLHHNESQRAPSSSPRHEMMSRDASSKYRFHEFNPTKAKLDKTEHIQHVNLQETHYNEAMQRHRRELNNIAAAHHSQEKKMREKYERSVEEERNRRHVLKDWPSHTPTSSRANEHMNHRPHQYPPQHNIPSQHSTPNRSASRSSDSSQHKPTVQGINLHTVQNPQVKALMAGLPPNVSSLLLPLIPPDCTPEMLTAILTSLSAQPQLPMELNFPGAVSPIRHHDRRLPLQLPNGQHRFMEHLPAGYPAELAAAQQAAVAAQQAAAANPLSRLSAGAANGLHPGMIPMTSMEHQLNPMRNSFPHASYMPNPHHLQGLQGLPGMNGLPDDPQSLLQLYQMYMYQMYASQMTSPNKPPMAADPLLFRSPKSRIPEYDWKFPTI